MNIEISKLRKALNLILDHIEQQCNGEVQIDQDDYWFVSRDSIYDPYIDMPELTMGQLSGDWENIKRILDKKDYPIGYSAVWASVLLRAIGDQTP